jgi:hypothetical protein
MEKVSTDYFSQIKEWGASLLSGKWLSSLDVIKLGTCFGVAFLAGLLFKKTFKYIILYGLGLIIGLSVLHYFNIINIIDVAKIKMMLGLADIQDWGQMTQFVAHQMKIHAVEVALSSAGLILGFKVG